MKLAGAQLVLDTNVLVHLLRDGDPGKLINQTYNVGYRKPRAIVPVVVRGEIRSFALFNKWGQAKMSKLDELLRSLPTVDISDAIISEYAEIDATTRGTGRKMGKNDLWIAAVAKVTNATLLTTDQDFDHLHPATISVEYIDPKKLLSGAI